MPTPSADTFAALARSSPWRWTTLRFTVSWPGSPWQTTPVRAWLHRPDALRVEDLDGTLLEAGRTSRPRVGILTTDGGRTVQMRRPLDDGAPAPERRPDGLVARRPEQGDVSFDDPMYQNYAWVAMLDPAELADPALDAAPGAAPLALQSVAAVEHAGRPAWEAVVVPTRSYEPRCGCCPLLRTREVDLLEWEGENLLEDYPDAYRVRLDVQTGVCVLTEEIGGQRPGLGHDLRIEAVDEAMEDALFVEPRRRRSGWSPYPARPGRQ